MQAPFWGRARFGNVWWRFINGFRTQQLSYAMLKLDGYLRVKEAAVYLGVSPNTLRNWGKAGRIEEHRHPVNNYRLYKKSDLDRLLNETEKSSV